MTNALGKYLTFDVLDYCGSADVSPKLNFHSKKRETGTNVLKVDMTHPKYILVYSHIYIQFGHRPIRIPQV